MAKRQSPVLKFCREHRDGLILFLVIGLALLFRFWRLNSLPPGLHPDEAANGLDIFRILEKHDWRPLYNTNGPREALFFYIQAIFVAFMGNTILALRMAPALLGAAGVYVTYLWARSWFGERTGLIAGFLMAVNPWAVTISRDGFRASMTPLFVALTLWLYTKAVQTRNRWWTLAAGASLGAGMYTYLAFRLFPLGLLLVVGMLAIWRRDFLRTWWKPLALSLVSFAVVMLPMALFGIKHPGDVAARATGTSFLNKDLNHGKPLETLLDSTVKSLLMFNIHGDENYRHNLGGEPELNVFVGIMFLLGILVALTHISRPKYFALLAIFGTMLLPELLTAEGIPHALRAIGAVGPTLILAALGIGYMLDRWYTTFPINSAARTTGLSAIVLLLALSGYHGWRQYFVAWAQSSQTYEAYSEDAVAIGQFLIQHPFDGDRYVVIDGYSDKTVEYLAHKKANYTRIDPSAVDSLAKDGNSKQFLIAISSKDETIKRLQANFPGGKFHKEGSAVRDAELFFVYQVSK